jgi:hypothetical protein
MSDAIKLRARGSDQQSSCAYCHGPLQNSVHTCPSCQTCLHEDCSRELGRCPTIGCAANNSAAEGAAVIPGERASQTAEKRRRRAGRRNASPAQRAVGLFFTLIFWLASILSIPVSLTVVLVLTQFAHGFFEWVIVLVVSLVACAAVALLFKLSIDVTRWSSSLR